MATFSMGAWKLVQIIDLWSKWPDQRPLWLFISEKKNFKVWESLCDFFQFWGQMVFTYDKFVWVLMTSAHMYRSVILPRVGKGWYPSRWSALRGDNSQISYLLKLSLYLLSYLYWHLSVDMLYWHDVWINGNVIFTWHGDHGVKECWKSSFQVFHAEGCTVWSVGMGSL